MKRSTFFTYFAGFILFAGLFGSCKKEAADTPPASPQAINGTVQKGPFITGTSVTIRPLDEKLDPTGESYETQISNDLGNFSLPAKITAPYAELIAQGYYFNEVRNDLSAAPITLRGITKVSEEGDKNVNLLTTLEAGRLRHLMTAEHKTFDEARTIAQREVLASFGITLTETTSSDCLDISRSGEGNAALLAISCLLQGDNSEAELSERTAKIANDIRDNGKITNAELLKEIQYNRTHLYAEYISKALRERYTKLGIANVQIPDIYGYLDSDGDGILNGAKPYLLIPELLKPKSFSYKQDTLELPVHSNVKWTAEIPADAAEWLSIDGQTNNDLLVLIIRENTESPRTAQVTLREEGGTLTETVNITQFGKYIQLSVKVQVATPSKTLDPSLESEVKNLVLIGFDQYGDMLFHRAIEELAFDTVNISVEATFTEKTPYCRVYAIANDFETYSNFHGNLGQFQAIRTYRDMNDPELPLTRTALKDVSLEYNRVNTIDLPLVHRAAQVVFNVKLNDQDFGPEAEIVEFTAKGIRSRSGLLFWLGRDTDPAYTNDLTVTRGTDNKYTFHVYGYTEMKQFEIKVRDNGNTMIYTTKFQESEFRPGNLYSYTATISKAQSGYN